MTGRRSILLVRLFRPLRTTTTTLKWRATTRRTRTTTLFAPIRTLPCPLSGRLSKSSNRRCSRSSPPTPNRLIWSRIALSASPAYRPSPRASPSTTGKRPRVTKSAIGELAPLSLSRKASTSWQRRVSCPRSFRSCLWSQQPRRPSWSWRSAIIITALQPRVKILISTSTVRRTNRLMLHLLHKSITLTATLRTIRFNRFNSIMIQQMNFIIMKGLISSSKNHNNSSSKTIATITTFCRNIITTDSLDRPSPTNLAAAAVVWRQEEVFCRTRDRARSFKRCARRRCAGIGRKATVSMIQR